MERAIGMDNEKIAVPNQIKSRIVIQKSIFLDILRGISILTGLLLGFIVPIMLRIQIDDWLITKKIVIPDWIYFGVYFLSHVVFIWIIYKIIKCKMYKRHNPAIDFLSAFILGYVPLYLLIFLAQLLWNLIFSGGSKWLF